MTHYQFYRLVDGVFTGQSFKGPERMLKANTPSGCGAVVGRFDPLTHRVDLQTKRAVFTGTKPESDRD